LRPAIWIEILKNLPESSFLEEKLGEESNFRVRNRESTFFNQEKGFLNQKIDFQARKVHASS